MDPITTEELHTIIVKATLAANIERNTIAKHRPTIPNYLHTARSWERLADAANAIQAILIRNQLQDEQRKDYASKLTGLGTFVPKT